MSKQKKPGRAPQPAPPERARAPSALDREVSPGNQALQDEVGATVDLDVIRDVAFPLVERAILALQVVPRDADRHERLVEILERSHLPEDRRQVLVDKLQTDRAAGLGVLEAVGRWFPGQPRTEVGRALDEVWRGLQEGHPDTGAWAIGEERIPLSGATLEGTVNDRAESLVGDLAGSGSFGVALRGFVRDVYLALAFDEEEEEDSWDPWAAELG